jgi:competence protein ComEA
MARIVQIVVWLAVGAVLAIGLVLYWHHQTERAIVIQPLPINATIVVDVRGGVATPGVVELPAASRVSDAVAASGGLTSDADVGQLNLAARLADGQKLVIPTGVPATTVVAAPAPATGQPAVQIPATSAPKSLVNLNTASADELKALPGIGEVLAGRIVAYREANGPFRSVDQLGEIKGISPKLLESLRPMVTIGG